MSLSKAKLQKLELSTAESTKAPSTLDEMDSDEEDRMSGSAVTSGKRSKAKPQHMRNPNAQAKNLRKAFVCQKK